MMKIFFLLISMFVTEILSSCQETDPRSGNRIFSPKATPDSCLTIANANVKTKIPWAASIDTSWIVAIYKEADRFTPFAQIEEYQQFDLHHADVIKVLLYMYKNNADFRQRLHLLELNRRQFYQTTKQSVVDDYRKYHSLEGMNFEYLCAKNDLTAKALLLKTLTDKKATVNDKIYARRMLKEHYSMDR